MIVSELELKASEQKGTREERNGQEKTRSCNLINKANEPAFKQVAKQRHKSSLAKGKSPLDSRA